MTADPTPRDAALERLSALADGELDAMATAEACAMWRDHATVRMTWHRYQLIGDVLRSEDLVLHAARDAAFLDGLRARLSAEPTVLAPQALVEREQQDESRQVANGTQALRRRRWTWMAPTAVAAGFVAVAGVLVVLRDPGPTASASPTMLAGAGLRAPSGALVPAAAISFGQQVGTGGSVVRDPRLDRYLAAHKEFAGNSALGLSSMYLRSASVEVPAR